MSDKVTMQDVARAADVSVAVVSRVLNNLPAVRPETRQRVQATMKRLCYQPDTRGRGASQGSRALRSPQHRHRRIMLLGFNANLKYGSPVYLDMLAGVEAELRDSAYAMELRCIPSGDSWDAAELAASVDGVVLLLSIHESPFDLLKLTRLVPCVQAMGPFTDSNPWDHVTYDNDAIGRLAARYLLERGHHRCAVATFPEDSPLFGTRVRAFSTSVAAAGGQVTVLRDRTMANPGYCMDGIGAGGITGIYSVADLLTPMLYENLRRAGHQPQQDVEIVSTNFERPLLSALQPAPAVVDIHAAEVGHRAVRQLLWRLDHPRHLHERVLVNVSLATPAEVQTHLWSSQPASQTPAFA